MGRRKKRKTWPPSSLTEGQILAWADAFHRLNRRWPRKDSGYVPGSWTERWSAINAALQKGHRGLLGGSSLARLLAARRGVRNKKGLPSLTVPQILRWADAYHRQNGTWPHCKTKPGGITGTNGETWLAVDTALRAGQRGLPGGSSLPQLLARHRGVRNPQDLPPLSADEVLAWADAFHARTGEWPKQKHWQEVIPGSDGETWGNVIQAIARGLRGFPGTGTLFDLLAERRGVRNVGRLPPLTQEKILTWADAHSAAHGAWPTCRCPEQAIPGSPGERWFNVDQALRKGLRGLPRRLVPPALTRRVPWRSQLEDGNGEAKSGQNRCGPSDAGMTDCRLRFNRGRPRGRRGESPASPARALPLPLRPNSR